MGCSAETCSTLCAHCIWWLAWPSSARHPWSRGGSRMKVALSPGLFTGPMARCKRSEGHICEDYTRVYISPTVGKVCRSLGVRTHSHTIRTLFSQSSHRIHSYSNSHTIRTLFARSHTVRTVAHYLHTVRTVAHYSHTIRTVALTFRTLFARSHTITIRTVTHYLHTIRTVAHYIRTLFARFTHYSRHRHTKFAHYSH